MTPLIIKIALMRLTKIQEHAKNITQAESQLRTLKLYIIVFCINFRRKKVNRLTNGPLYLAFNG